VQAASGKRFHGFGDSRDNLGSAQLEAWKPTSVSNGHGDQALLRPSPEESLGYGRSKRSHQIVVGVSIEVSEQRLA